MELNKKQEILIEKLNKIDDFNSKIDAQIKEATEFLQKIQFRIADMEKKENLLNQKELEIERKSSEKVNELHEFEKNIKTLIIEKSIGFPWLSKAFSDYLNLQDQIIISFLRTKKHPANSAADSVRDIAVEKKVLTEQLLICNYRIKYYESLFPFITEFVDENIDELLIQASDGINQIGNEDPIKRFLTHGEYENLTSSQRNQVALDRYFSSRKSSFQIGRDFERYIGYLYEKQGYKVCYQGIIKGYEDLGRDLICKKGSLVEIIQCKYWASYKLIHEKHINQLFGTTVKYFVDNYSGQNTLDVSSFTSFVKKGYILPVFYTSTKLSDIAKKFANTLGIKVFEDIHLESYPVIKCHTNKLTGEKIYHLPFDQMYDRTNLEEEYDEFYAWKISEAEEKGFRRAYKWRGENN